jgi:hypothetical protein
MPREINQELEDTGQTLPALANMTLAKFDSTVYNAVSEYLVNLKRYYIKRYNTADQQREKKIFSVTSTPEKEEAFSRYREAYHNDAITELVKNTSETHRIIDQDGKLIQKIYPIYKDPDPEHAIDFNAQFYMPQKHFLNRNIDTFYFNTGVIWSMSLVLALMLYFDVLRRIIDGISNISNPLYRKKD